MCHTQGRPFNCPFAGHGLEKGGDEALGAFVIPICPTPPLQPPLGQELPELCAVSVCPSPARRAVGTRTQR